MQFKTYLIEAEKKMEMGDLQDTLNKIPADHKKLLKGYKFHTQDGNTLKNDDDNIGSNDLSNKSIVIAAPWNYGREFTFLHELAHIVWMKYIQKDKKKREQWQNILKKTNIKSKDRDNAEELFCHAYANTYTQNAIQKHSHPSWEAFIKSI